MRYVSDAHKEEMKKIHAIKAVQVAMVEAVKDLGVDAGNSSVERYVDERLGPIYNMFDRPRDAGLTGTDSACTNANYSLCHCKGFIERGGDYDNNDPSLEYGQWRFAPGGYEAARNWIPRYDYIKELIDSIVAEYDGPTLDAVDEIISISCEEDPDAVLLTDTEPNDKDQLKTEIKAALHRIADLHNEMAELFDKLSK